MAKKITEGSIAKKKIMAGVNKLANPVISTLGPKGRNVAINSGYGIKILHDGVSVAKSIILEDEFENTGAQIVKQAAMKTNDISGDGTTTSTLLAQKMIEEGFHLIESGVNPMLLKKGMEKALQVIKTELDKLAIPITTLKELTDVATISAQNPLIGEKVAEAIQAIGPDGIVSVKEGSKDSIEVERVEGIEIENGLISPYFVTNTDRMECEIENPLILITDKKFGSFEDIAGFLSNVIRISKAIVIIADEVDQEALTTLVKNKMDAKLYCAAVKAPGFGDRKRGILEDLAIVTGGRVISDEEGVDINNIPLDYLGKAELFWGNRDKSRLINGKGDKEAINKRVAYLKAQAKLADNEFDKQKYLERAAILISGIALIRVGALTDIEAKDRIERVKDAVGASRAAKEQGIIIGGGVALLRVQKALKMATTFQSDKDIVLGMEVVLNALSWPARQLLLNAGENERKLVEVANLTDNQGYNIMTGKIGDLIEMGIIDPVLVTKSALENAISVAGMLLTMDYIIAEKIDRNSPNQA